LRLSNTEHLGTHSQVELGNEKGVLLQFTKTLYAYPMPLESRLLAVAKFIKSNTHADIGSDHALLPRYLLQNRQINKAIIIEKTQQPFENASAALRGLNADVRLGDGLTPLGKNEADSLSITGMGAYKITQILQAHPKHLPDKLTLQPNDNARLIRMWARESGFHLKAETMVQGYWRYTVLHFEKSQYPDPCYQDVSLEVALIYGPHLLKAKHPLLKEELEYHLPYLKSLGSYGAAQVDIARQALDYISDEAGNPQ
jgi:tRNA (adenine22-N1)-methyltransferase